MDDEIQDTVESILGKGVKVVDCQKTSSIKEEEVLLVNGCPVPLEGEDGAAIRNALIHGVVPDCDLLNQLLIRAGILKAPVRLETSLSVKSSVVTREEVTVAKGGQVVDERTRETKEDNYYTSNSSEVWEPVGVVPLKGKGSIKVIQGGKEGYGSYSSCSSDPSTSADSAFYPSDIPHTSCGSAAPKRTHSSTSTDSANSSRDTPDFFPPNVNASTSPFIPSCSRNFVPPCTSGSSSCTTTTTSSYGPGGCTTTTRTTRSGRAGSPEYSSDVDSATARTHTANVNGMQKVRINEVPPNTTRVSFRQVQYR